MSSQIRITHVATHTYPQVFKHIIAQQDFNGGKTFTPFLLTGSMNEMSYAIHRSRLFPLYCPDVLIDLLPRFEPDTDIFQLYLSIHDINPMLSMLSAVGQKVMAKTVLHCNDFSPAFEQKHLATLQQCRGIIVPSPAMVPQFAFAKIPVMYLPNKAPSRLVSCDTCDQPTEDAIALCADVVDNGGRGYRDYTWAQFVCEQNFRPLHVYPTRITHDTLLSYSHVMATLPYPPMLRSMSNHCGGWAGASNNEHDINTCVTNKFWDYLAAGIPPVLYRSKAMRDIMDAMFLPYESHPSKEAHGPYVALPDDYDEMANTSSTSLFNLHLGHAWEDLKKIPRELFGLESDLAGYVEFLSETSICNGCGHGIESCRKSKIACCPDCTHKETKA
jgi:hypothetical protein